MSDKAHIYRSGDKLTKQLIFGDEVEITVGVIDQGAISLYRNGQCHAFAVELHELTGLPVGIIVNDEGDHIHYVCIVDDDNVVDITGFCDLSEFTIVGDWELRPRWLHRIRDFSPREYADQEEDYSPPDYELARYFAQTLAEFCELV